MFFGHATRPDKHERVVLVNVKYDAIVYSSVHKFSPHHFQFSLPNLGCVIIRFSTCFQDKYWDLAVYAFSEILIETFIDDIFYFLSDIEKRELFLRKKQSLLLMCF